MFSAYQSLVIQIKVKDFKNWNTCLEFNVYIESRI
jgi:hypothetical protein